MENGGPMVLPYYHSDANNYSNGHVKSYSRIRNAATGYWRAWHNWFLACVALFVIIGAGWILIKYSFLKTALIWLNTQPKWTVYGVFMVLYFIVSFPFTWGYILLNFACGYQFGFILGVLVASSSALVAITFSFLIMKTFCSLWIVTRLLNISSFRTLYTILEGKQAFKLIVVSRLTPVPFGLQNALFAVSRLKTFTYLSASTLGLLPSQLIGVYLGTNMHTMEDIFEDKTRTASAGYFIFASQVIISAFFITYLIRKARKELDKTIQEELAELKVTIA